MLTLTVKWGIVCSSPYKGICYTKFCPKSYSNTPNDDSIPSVTRIVLTPSDFSETFFLDSFRVKTSKMATKIFLDFFGRFGGHMKIVDLARYCFTKIGITFTFLHRFSRLRAFWKANESG